MLEIILRIVSVLGIILLALLALFAAVVLLVLFVPVFYRVRGSRDAGGMALWAEARWLPAKVRVEYCHPGTVRAVVKALWFVLYEREISLGRSAPSGEDSAAADDSDVESGAARGANNAAKDSGGEEREDSGIENFRGTGDGADGSAVEADADAGGNAVDSGADTEAEGSAVESGADTEAGGSAVESDAETGGSTVESGADAAESSPESGEAAEESADGTDTAAERAAFDFQGGKEETGEEEPPPQEKISQKIEKLKYTIGGIYDKIKKIWENISYYLDLMREEETKALFSHVFFRLGKMLRSIRPRHISADILFGAGAPDTTGYLYGVYCMLSPSLGAEVKVTPDFQRAVLQGRFEASGHIAIWVLAVNGLRVLLDRKLRRFLKKLKISEEMEQHKP